MDKQPAVDVVKDIDYYMALPYPILLYPPDPIHPEDGWAAEIPNLPGCGTSAETKEEIFALIEDAKYTWLEVSLEHGDPIPEPRRD